MKLRSFLDQFDPNPDLSEEVRSQNGLLIEAVLFTPAEIALKAYIDQAPSEITKKWIATNLKNWLLKRPQNLYKLPYLPANATPQQIKAFEFKDLYELRLTPDTKTQIEHIMDWFRMNPEPLRLERMTPDQVIQTADAEIAAYNKRVAKQMKDHEPEANYKVLMEFPGGYRMVELLCQPALDREGNLMGHCIGTHHGGLLKAKTHRMFSLRGPDNQPHATIEAELSTDGMTTTEIKGKKNQAPTRRYWPMITTFLEKMGIEADRDSRNVGLINVHIPGSNSSRKMSLEQFSDMINDPNNEEGKELLQGFKVHPRRYSDDVAMGMFDVLYARDEVDDKVLYMGMDKFPTHVVQAIQHYGNKLSPEQLSTVIIMLGNWRGYHTLISDLIQTAIFDVQQARQIIDSLDDINKTRVISSLSRSKPNIYMGLIDSPEFLEDELDAKNERASAPFFAMISAGKPLTPKMYEGAFEYYPKEAIQALKKNSLPEYSDDSGLAAITGLSQYYESDESNVLQAYTKATIELMKIQKPVLMKFLDRQSDDTYTRDRQKTFSLRLIRAARDVDPNLVDEKVEEKALIAIKNPKLYAEFLSKTPHPSTEIQSAIWDQAEETSRRGYSNDGSILVLRHVQSFDPEFWSKTIDLLRLKSSDIQKTKKKSISLKKPIRKNGYTETNRLIDVPLNAEEQRAAYMKAHNEKAGKFMTMFTNMVMSPEQEIEEAVEPDLGEVVNINPTKLQQAREEFARRGKTELFGVVLRRLNREDAMKSIASNVGDHSYSRFNPGVESSFVKNLNRLPAKDIAKMINSYGGSYSKIPENPLFGVLVNNAPEKVPEVIARSVGISRGYIWGSMKQKMDKERLFQSLEHVWASDLEDGVKDEYTVAVFKRFKPKPDQLINMLLKADSAEAVFYVAKKTKNPSPEFIHMVVREYPYEKILALIPLEKYTDDDLAELAKDSTKEFGYLMKRDLRGWQSTNTRSKWASNMYTTQMDRNSSEFHRLRNAAVRAGIIDKFDQTVRAWEHEEAHGGSEHTGRIDYENKDRKTPSISEIKKHLHEYSTGSLRHFIDQYSYQKDDGKGLNELRLVYMNELSPKELLGLISSSLFKDSAGYYHGSGTFKKELISQLSPDKLQSMFDIMMRKNTLQDESKRFVHAAFPLIHLDDGDLIKVLSKDSEALGYIENPSDQIKSWVAENRPHDMKKISVPNADMVRALFDQFGKAEFRKGKQKVDYWFVDIANSWFNDSGQSYRFKYRDNPTAMKLIVDEAKRRGGMSLPITRAWINNLNKIKSSEMDKFHSSFTELNA